LVLYVAAKSHILFHWQCSADCVVGAEGSDTRVRQHIPRTTEYCTSNTYVTYYHIYNHGILQVHGHL